MCLFAVSSVVNERAGGTDSPCCCSRRVYDVRLASATGPGGFWFCVRRETFSPVVENTGVRCRVKTPQRWAAQGVYENGQYEERVARGLQR